MAVASVRIAPMAKKKHAPDGAGDAERPKGRRPAYQLNARISVELGQYFAEFIQGLDPVVSTKAAVESALRDWIRKHGGTPPGGKSRQN